MADFYTMVEFKSSLSLVLAHHLDPPIRMLTHAIDDCPDHLWAKTDGLAPAWQHALHAVYYLDKWLRLPVEPFNPPAFVDRTAVDFAAPPEPALDREQLRRYLQNVTTRCHELLQTADNDLLLAEVESDGRTLSLMDRALSQMRHVTYHVGCISTILNQYTGEALPWIGYEKPT